MDHEMEYLDYQDMKQIPPFSPWSDILAASLMVVSVVLLSILALVAAHFYG